MKRRHVISGRIELLHRITDFCREVYLRTFGPQLGPKKYAELTLADGVDLYLSACVPGTTDLPA